MGRGTIEKEEAKEAGGQGDEKFHLNRRTRDLLSPSSKPNRQKAI
jgi:hypothetical protein